jgi:type III restriction enzyme
MGLKTYQEEAINELIKKSNELLELQDSKTIVFEAPTGSGKTIMMAGFLKQLVENREDDKQFSFIWTAPRQLHTQSKEKLEQYYFDSKAIRCSYFEDLTDKQINENEILFLNWESINKTDNIYVRDNENDFNLSHIVESTISEGRIIILIIDESHFAAKTETSQELIRMIQPKISIEVSATPHITGDEKVTVHREKVIDQQMIKKRVSLNPDFKNIIKQQRAGEIGIASSAAESTNEIVIKTAIEKRNYLHNSMQVAGINVNPLMLIQLPDRRQGVEDVQEDIVQILKENHSIAAENGKLAIYLSEDKTNLENIKKNDSEVEVMIFKQAIALGWDCPRAAILVLFRDWKSITFSIQTIGRILRMPELKHYANDELNTGFIYTNLSDISIQEDIAGSYLTINHSKRKNDYEDISLLSVHSKRFREETRLNPQFILDFMTAAKELNLAKNINTDIKQIEATLITDGVITNPDKTFAHLADKGLFEKEHFGQTFKITQTEMEIQTRFDLFIRENLVPFAPEKRSVGRVKDAVYRFFQHEFPMKFEYGGDKIQKIVLSPKNQKHFINVINNAKEIYHQNVGKGKKQIVPDEQWGIPLSIDFNNNYILRDTKLCVMEPFFEADNTSVPEQNFMAYLEAKADEIEWWFKNGQRDGTYFAVPYMKNGQTEPFYVDWIVKYKNGKIGLFDTKSGITAEIAKSKAEGLAKYIKEENENGKNLFGGIVVQKDNSWRYNDNEVYEYNEHDLSNWKFL